MARARLQTGIRQEQLTDATMVVLAERGLRGFSVAAVARRVGITASGIYRHFASKDAILDAVLDRMRERLQGAVAAAREEGSDPVDVLRRLLERHMQLIRDTRALPRIMLSDEYHAGHPERRERLLAMINGYLERVGDVLREGQREGLVRTDVNARSLAIVFLGLIQPAGVLWVLSDGRFDVAEQARAAWPVFEQAIRAPARRRPAARSLRARRAPS